MTQIISILVPAYRVRYKGPNGKRRYGTYRTRERAFRRLAWWLVFDYGKPKAHGLICDCNNEEVWGYCAIHNRGTGYYRRMHIRVLRWLEKGYILPQVEAER